MVVKEQVNEAPKKRGRPKGSKNKVTTKSVKVSTGEVNVDETDDRPEVVKENVIKKRKEKKADDGFTASSDSKKKSGTVEGKTKRTAKKESDLKNENSVSQSSENTDSSKRNSQVNFFQDNSKTDSVPISKKQDKDKSGDSKKSTLKQNNSKQAESKKQENIPVGDVTGDIVTVTSESSDRLSFVQDAENPFAAPESEVEKKVTDGKNSTDEKKTTDGKVDTRKKKRRSTAVYVNSIVGMVRYDESPLSQEPQEPEVTVEEENVTLEPETEVAEPSREPSGIKVEGIFELSDQSGAAYGFLRQNGISSEDDIYVSPMFVKKFNLKSGESVRGYAKLEQTDRHRPITFVTDVNGVPPYTTRSKCRFDDMTPQFPKERFHLSKSTNDIAMRIIDLIAPVGKGQRGLIVAPPKSGKTILLQKIAKSIKRDYPEVELMILLIDERPEEVTDMKEEVDAAVYYSTFDELPMNHIRIAELVLSRARGLVEMGRDVVILLDSITRLARAYNIAMPASGRTLSGGLDTSALHKPKRFLGSARNMIEGGSLTIMATALIETGSKMDDVIFEEFKGTGNMELILDRKLSEKRIFPSIDIKRSGTRREELLLNREEYEAIMKLRRALDQTSGNEPVELLSEELMRTKDNAELIAWINKVFVDSKFGKVR